MRRKVLYLLVLLTLACVSLIPVSVSAQPQDSVSRQVSALERQIRKVLAKHGVSGPEDAYKLDRLAGEESAAFVEMMRTYADLRATAEVDTSYRALASETADVQPDNSTSPVMATSGAIAVNGNTSGHLRCYARSSNRHAYKAGKSWFPVGVWKADAHTPGTAEAVTVVGPAGFGSAWAWAYAGQTIEVTGSGGTYATITMNGYYEGLLSCFGSASAAWTLDFIVKDLNTGTTYTENIDHDSSQVVRWCEYHETYNRSLVVFLRAGHTYLVHLKIHTSASIKSGGEAGADFGPFDGDGGFTWYHYFDVDW
ncbi:MAG: hypothetical protein JW753_11755 [Dehalococcoidia bacterium]|nr:hypothetical protein [Dehalococcoidia bacterium]